MSRPAHLPLPLSAALARYVEQRTATMSEARRQLGINEIDARALVHVHDNPGVRPTQLREHLGITSAGVTALADRLITRSLLRREQDPDDRRVNHLYVEVDLAEAPWSALTAFDDTLDRELRSRLDRDTDDLAEILGAASDAASRSIAYT